MEQNNVLKRKLATCRDNPVLGYSLLSQHALPPTKSQTLAAGCDLYSAHDYVVPARGRCKIFTDLRIYLPNGCYGRVADRSSVAWKLGLTVMGTVIDKPFKGNVFIILYNTTDNDVPVQRHMKIAQLICERLSYVEIERVE